MRRANVRAIPAGGGVVATVASGQHVFLGCLDVAKVQGAPTLENMNVGAPCAYYSPSDELSGWLSGWLSGELSGSGVGSGSFSKI